MTIENISWSISTKECCRTWRGSNLQPPDHHLDMHPTEKPRLARLVRLIWSGSLLDIIHKVYFLRLSLKNSIHSLFLSNNIAHNLYHIPGKFSRRIFMIFFLIFPEKGFDISSKLYPKETICMKWQSPHSGKNKKKNIWNVASFSTQHAVLIFYHSVGNFSRRQIDDNVLIFPRKQDLTFHANCLLRDNLHEMSNPVFWEK